MTMERKSFIAVETKAVADAPAGTVEAFVSASLNEDFGGDVVQPGAFRDFIGDVKSGVWPKWPTLLWNHSIELGLAAVTGKVTDMEELMPGDARLPQKLLAKGLGGMRIRGQYNLKTQPGREAYEHVLAGDVSDWSYMYETRDHEMDAKGRRLLKTIYPVYEVSNVLVGMNPETFTIGVKSLLAALAVEPAPQSRRAILLAQVREIIEPFEGYIVEDEKTYQQGKKYHTFDAETGELIQTSVEVIETKDAQITMIGDEAMHQGALNQAMAAIAALIRQEMAEDSYELDDVRWLAGIGADLRSWAQSENWDAISDARSAAAISLQAPPSPAAASDTPPVASTPAQPLTAPASGSSFLVGIPATDDNPPLDNPQRILDPYSRSANLEVETKGEEILTDVANYTEADPLKVEAAVALLFKDLLPKIDINELVQAPEPLPVIEDSGVRDGFTNWARRRLRR